MADYSKMANWLLGAPAKAYNYLPTPPPQTNSPLGNYLLSMAQATDPVQAFGGYGGLAAMALPPGAGTLNAFRGVTKAELGIGSRPGQPMYFSPSPEVASGYAKGLSNTPEGSAVYPVKLRMRRAFRVNRRANVRGEVAKARDSKWLKANGYDSAIIYDPKNPQNTEYIIPDMGPIRSAQGRKF